MILRRFNYTNRIKLAKDSVVIRTFSPTDGPPMFEATINLSNYSLPDGTSIYLEAFYRNSMMRFLVGTVNSQSPLYYCRGELTEIQDPQINFRLKIVDESEDIGRLVAIADRIQTFNESSKQVVRVGLLPVKFEDLGDQIWLLEIPQDGTDPVMCVNSSLDTGSIPISEIVRNNPLFLTLVFPQVIRRIFEELLFNSVETYEEADADDHWGKKWMNYAVAISGLPKIDAGADDVDKVSWIDAVVQAFCNRNNIKGSFEKYIMEMQ